MRAWLLVWVLTLLLVLPGCEAIGRIFEAGVWVGVIAVLAVIGLGWLITSLFRR